MKVAGLGQASFDYTAIAEKYPPPDSKEEVLEWVCGGGGPVATALVSLSRLGVETFFMGRVGDDRSGRLIRAGLKEEGVDTRGLRKKPGGSSQTAFIVVEKVSGKRTIFWQRPTVEALHPGEVNVKRIRECDLLLIDGLMHEASLRAASIARKAGVPVMIDAGTLREGTLQLCALSDHIVCSESFANALAPSPRAALKELSTLGARSLTVTLGERGSTTLTDGGIFRTPAFKVRAVDTTGAGDVFHGGYIYGLLKGWPIEKTVEFASAFAALKCLKPGGRAGIATLSETLGFMKKGRK